MEHTTSLDDLTGRVKAGLKVNSAMWGHPDWERLVPQCCFHHQLGHVMD